MAYEIIPLNKKLLLERANLEEDPTEDGPQFYFGEETKTETVEYFRIIDVAKDVAINAYKGDIITVEFYHPLGNINGKQLFVADEKTVTTRILKDKK